MSDLPVLLDGGQQLPDGWELTTLGKLANYINGRAFKPTDWKTTGRPIIRIQNLTGSTDTVNRFSGEVEPKYIIRDGDLLISWSATLGAFIYRGEEAVLNQHIFKVEPFVNKKFLFYLVKAYLDTLKRQVHGSGMQHITKGKFDNSPVPLPPPDEQKRIAEKLDTLLARVDSCQTHLERVPQILKRFRQSVLAAATSGRLTEDWREEKGDNDKQKTSSDEIPAGWYWAPISELVTNQDNKRIPIRLQDRAERRGKYPYYGAFGIIDSIDEFLYDGEYLLVAEDGKNLEKRDRPIALIASGQFWVNNHAHVLQTLDNLLLKYLCFWFNSPTLDLEDYLTGIDQVKLTRGALDRISVPVPPLEEQAEIVRRVEKLFAYAERLEARYTSASEHVERLTPSLLAKAFRGELVGQES